MDWLQQSQGGTLNAYWERAGVAWDPGANVQVAVYSNRQTPSTPGVAPTPVLLASGTASGSGNQGRTFTLTAAQTAQLDYLTVTWTASDGSVLTTYAEIQGSYSFSVAQARTKSPLQDATTYPASSIVFYRGLAEQALEDILGFSVVPRYRQDIATITGSGLLMLPRRKLRNILWITQAGLTVPVLVGLRLFDGGLVYTPGLWQWYSWWSQPIEIGYEEGLDSCPYRISNALLLLARRWVVESPWDERMTSFRSREGGDLEILTADHSNPFDIPEIVAIAGAYGTPLVG